MRIVANMFQDPSHGVANPPLRWWGALGLGGGGSVGSPSGQLTWCVTQRDSLLHRVSGETSAICFMIKVSELSRYEATC